MSLYLGEEKIQNISVGLQNAGLDITGLNNETTTSLNGIIKGENGKVTTAVPGTDYLAPDALNSLGSLANKSKVSESDLDDTLKQTIQDASNIQLPEGIVQNNIVNTFTVDGKITMANGYTPSADGDVANKKWVEQQVKSAVPAFSNGPILFESSGTFNPSEYNLAVGDKIQVICIGGGGGGGYSGAKNGTRNYGGAAGTLSNGDYGTGGYGASPGTSYAGDTCGRGGNGGSGYLTKLLHTIDSLDAITITIGVGGAADSAGTATSFGQYLVAEGGKAGGIGGGSYYGEGRDETWSPSSGSTGAGGTTTGAGWTVKSYIEQDSSGSLHKGSGAVFIWY